MSTLISIIRWDHAGGVLIYEEAGGKVTDLDGKAIDFSTGRKMSASTYFSSKPTSVSILANTIRLRSRSYLCTK